MECATQDFVYSILRAGGWPIRRLIVIKFDEEMDGLSFLMRNSDGTMSTDGHIVIELCFCFASDSAITAYASTVVEAKAYIAIELLLH